MSRRTAYTLAGVGMFGAMVYMPVYLQVVLGVARPYDVTVPMISELVISAPTQWVRSMICWCRSRLSTRLTVSIVSPR